MGWLTENALSILAVLGCLGTLGGVGVFVYKWGEWKGSVDVDRGTFKSFMEEVRRDIKEILNRLPPTAVTGQSPIQLTDLGKKIVETLTADQWIEPYAEQRLQYTSDMSLYQIQQYAFEFAENELLKQLKNLDPERVKAIESCAFQHGIPVDVVMKALGVVLRDKIFALNKLSIKDIPPTAPPAESAG